eukprot:jgi/Picsp_1/6481/NSC_03827-R1_gpi inositol-deacylase-like
MVRMSHRNLFMVLVCAISIAVLFIDIYPEYIRSRICDTTYINPSYEEVEVPEQVKRRFPRYRLQKYVERDSNWVPHTVVTRAKLGGVFPVLFVHGHLGSHEQMRSMASETAKEISRRMGGGRDVQWLQCMGGILVDQLLAVPGDSIAFGISLGSPHFHFPQFAMRNILKSQQHENEITRRFNKRSRNVSSFRIFSGPGDLLVPSLSAWSVHGTLVRQRLLQVDMDDIPGVWATATHKGIVSCNQLVRRVVAFLLDGVDAVGSGASDDELFDLGNKWLISKLNLGWNTFNTKEKEQNLLSQPLSDQDNLAKEVSTGCHQLSGWMTYTGLESNSAICYKWNANELLKDNALNSIFQILVYGLSPGKDFQLIGSFGSRDFDLTSLLGAIPSITISEESTVNRRHWLEVIKGIDWIENSTWVSEIPINFGELRKLDQILLRIKPTDPSQKSRGVVTGYREPRVMPREGHAPSNEGRHLGPIVLIREEDLIDIWHRDVPRFAHKICNVYWSFIWALFPLRIEFQIEGQVEGNEFAKSDKGMLDFRPILVAKSKTNDIKTISDTIRRSFRHKLDVPLWHPGIIKRDLFFIVGPSTRHATRIHLDFPRFISYSLRYQVYAVPGLAFGSRLIQNALRSRGARVGRYPQDSGSLKFLYAVATCLFFTWFTPLANLTPLVPNQNPLGTLCILTCALSIDAVVSSIFVAIIKVLRDLGMGSLKPLLKGDKSFVALICFVLPFHDLLPFFLTVAYLLSLSMLDSKKVMNVSGNFLLPVDWLLLLLYAMFPLVIAMSGGYIFGYPHREIYSFTSTERLMVMLTSLGIIFSCRSKAVGSVAKFGDWCLEKVLLVLVGEYVALASLWGQNYIPPLFITVISVYFLIKFRKTQSLKR